MNKRIKFVQISTLQTPGSDFIYALDTEGFIWRGCFPGTWEKMKSPIAKLDDEKDERDF